MGFSASARKTPLSVKRNRSKRLLAEAYRATTRLIKEGYDIVISADKGLSESGLEMVKEKMLKLYKKSGIIK